MKILVYCSFALLVFAASAAQRSTNSNRVPPPGSAISEADRVELRSGVQALGKEIDSLRSALADKPQSSALIPDVQIFHKAVDWALRYDEFYRSNEISIARNLLKQGTERARQLREGKAAWTSATGLVVRAYVSKIDGSIQPYGLVVPASYKESKPHRLDVWLHGRDNNLTELKFISDRQRSYGEFTPPDTLVLHPYGRYCNAFKFAGEVDVFEGLEHVKSSYRVDENRIAIRGFSMGGAGTWHLAAHHPNVWAAAAPGAGFAETAEYTKALAREQKPAWFEQKLWQLYDATDYAANFFNLPVVAYNGTEDPQRQAADMMERAMKIEGLALPRVWGTNVGHKYTPEGKVEVSKFVDEVVGRGRDSSPARERFTTRTLRYNEGLSIRMDGLEKHWERANVELDAAANDSWIVRTTNTSAFTIRRHVEALRRLVVDGQNVDEAAKAAGAISLRKDANGKWQPGSPNGAVYSKSAGLQGPIDDAFTDSFLVVRPISNPQNEKIAAWISGRLARATNEWRAQFRGDVRVKDDSQVTDADINTHHLILWGDPTSNRLLARIADKLPIQWSRNEILVGAKRFAGASHVPAFIYPNPLNPKHYVVINSGFTFADAGSASNAQQTPKLPDYAVFDVEHGGLAAADFFDEQWKLR